MSQFKTATTVESPITSIAAVLVLGQTANGEFALVTHGSMGNLLSGLVASPALPAPQKIAPQKTVEVAPPTMPVQSPTDDKAALLAQCKALGIKQKGMHFMKAETLAALIASKGNGTPAPKAAAPAAPQNSPAPKDKAARIAAAFPNSPAPKAVGGAGPRRSSNLPIKGHKLSTSNKAVIYTKKGAEMVVWVTEEIEFSPDNKGKFHIDANDAAIKEGRLHSEHRLIGYVVCDPTGDDGFIDEKNNKLVGPTWAIPACRFKRWMD
jgi:hypothetical protein